MKLITDSGKDGNLRSCSWTKVRYMNAEGIFKSNSIIIVSSSRLL